MRGLNSIDGDVKDALVDDNDGCVCNDVDEKGWYKG